MRGTVRTSMILTALALTLALLAGCGGDGQTTTTAGADGGAPTGEPIKIGAPIPLTGPWAADGVTMKEGLEMAVDDLNAAGGVLGRPVELVTFDVEDMAAEKLTAAADKLVMQDGVSAIITGYSTPGADVTAFGRYPVPYLQFDASSLNVSMIEENPTQYGHIFTLGDIEAPYGVNTFDIVSSLPYDFPNKKVVILAGDFEWDKKITEAIRDRAEAKGWEVALHEVFPYGTREWGPQLSKIRDINPAIIFHAVMDPADTKTFLDQFAQDPTDSLVEVGYVASINEFTNLVGESGNGILGMSTNSILPNEAGEAWKKRFQEKMGHPAGLSIIGTVYDGVMLWAKGVEKAGDPSDYDAVSEAMAGLDYTGLNGTYRFTAAKTVEASDAGLPMHFFQVQDGALKLLYVGTQKQADFVTPPWLQ